MTPRPGRIAEIVEVDLPRPRAAHMRESPAFLALVARVRNLFIRSGVLHDDGQFA